MSTVEGGARSAGRDSRAAGRDSRATGTGPAVGATVRSAAGAVARALRRPGTYPGAAREMLATGLQIALYPMGVLSATLDLDAKASHGGRFDSQYPLCYLDPGAACTPIVLLHGYFHNRSAFVMMRRALRRYGFRYVDTFNYNAFAHDVSGLAVRVARRVEELQEKAGAERVHIIGHSLGGLVARYYVQELGGDQRVHTCMTIGTPHAGTYAALAARTGAARALRPGSPLIRRLEESARPTPVRFVSYYSNFDGFVIPASSAKLTIPALQARNVLIKDQGHLSLLISGPLIHSIARTLANLDDDAPAAELPLRRRPARPA